MFSSIFALIGLTALPIFTYGLYSFVNETPTEFKEQGSGIVKLLAVYCMLSFIFFLISETLAPVVPTDPSSSELQAAANATLLISLIGLIPEVLFLIGAIKFTEWFNEVVSRMGIYDSTTKFKWVGILKVTTLGTLILTFLILLSQFGGSGSYETLLLAAFLLLISAIATLAVSIVQILAGYKIYKILKQVQYVH